MLNGDNLNTYPTYLSNIRSILQGDDSSIPASTLQITIPLPSIFSDSNFIPSHSLSFLFFSTLPRFFSHSLQTGTGQAYLQEINLDMSQLENNKEADGVAAGSPLQAGSGEDTLSGPEGSVTPPWAVALCLLSLTLHSCVPGLALTPWFWSSVGLSLLDLSPRSEFL